MPGEAAMHPPDLRIEAKDSQEAIQQLVDLGYVEDLSKDAHQRVAETVRELRYNFARSYMGTHHPSAAVPILTDLWEAWPKESRFGVKLLTCLLDLGQLGEARTVLSTLKARKQAYAQEAQEELKTLKVQLQEKKLEEYPEPEARKLRHQLSKLKAQATMNPTTWAFLEGTLLHAEGRYQEALTALERAKSVQTHQLPDVYHIARCGSCRADVRIGRP
ncbi:MAG: hypothetical protein D6704_07485 [Nitrospirae bacterium]|nr:MAG: hypothetical protein D6704_07485 [Nitrospirota bacterium]